MQYQLLPDLTPEEYEALKADIRERGVQVRVEYDEYGNILDGHHRVQICRELGIKDWPRVTRAGLTEQQKQEHILALNLNRRHLSREQRQELVGKLRGNGWSTTRIAEKLHTSDETVRRDIAASTNVEPLPVTITGKDGKQYPAQRPDPVPQPVLAIVEAEEAPTENRPLVPHVAQATGDQEWYTPAEYIEAARFVMGEIDCDPATSDLAQRTVQANTYYTAQNNGLVHDWQGRVWLNPPYASGLVDAFTERLTAQYEAGNTQEAIVLVNNATETRWFGGLVRVASAIVFPTTRVRFLTPDGSRGAPLQGQAVVYVGENKERFLSVFGAFGWGCRVERD